MSVREDRQVHAVCPDGTEVVRYDVAGKWYAEPASGTRRALSITEAATLASQPDADVRFGLGGGVSFDRKVRRLRRAPAS